MTFDPEAQGFWSGNLHGALFDDGADVVQVVSEATHGQTQHLDLRLRPLGSEDEHSVSSRPTSEAPHETNRWVQTGQLVLQDFTCYYRYYPFGSGSGPLQPAKLGEFLI